MRRANIRIKGNVQMAGFRTFIKNIADSLNVKGFAENLDDESVKVVCEGEEEGINELINSTKENIFFYFLQNKCSLCVKKVIHIRKLFM